MCVVFNAFNLDLYYVNFVALDVPSSSSYGCSSIHFITSLLSYFFCRLWHHIVLENTKIMI